MIQSKRLNYLLVSRSPASLRLPSQTNLLQYVPVISEYDQYRLKPVRAIYIFRERERLGRTSASRACD